MNYDHHQKMNVMMNYVMVVNMKMNYVTNYVSYQNHHFLQVLIDEPGMNAANVWVDLRMYVLAQYMFGVVRMLYSYM